MIASRKVFAVALKTELAVSNNKLVGRPHFCIPKRFCTGKKSNLNDKAFETSQSQTVNSEPIHKNTPKNTTVAVIGETFHFAERKLEDLERNLMKSINESNQRRFRIGLLLIIFGITGVTMVFGGEIRKMLTEQTAGLAKETLENESLKIQTQELAMAVVQTILNDKEIAAHAASFLREASTAPETQEALLKLTLHLLQHKETVQELTILAKKLIDNLCNDKATVAQLGALFATVADDALLKVAIVKLIGDLCMDPAVNQAVTKLALDIMSRQDINKATTLLLTESSTALLADEELKEQSRQFVVDVVGDDLLQQEGGNALWKSVTYALQPGLIRVTGVTLLAVSFGVAKVMLSPY